MNNALQDELVLLVLWTKEFDWLRKSLHSSSEMSVANRESYGFSNTIQASWELLTIDILTSD